MEIRVNIKSKKETLEGILKLKACRLYRKKIDIDMLLR